MAALVSGVGRGIGRGRVHEEFEVSVSPKRLLPSFFFTKLSGPVLGKRMRQGRA